MKGSLLALMAAFSSALGQNAPVVKDNLAGVVYTAELLSKNSTTINGVSIPGSTIAGSVTAGALKDEDGVTFAIDFVGFPNPGGRPFTYHIHTNPVPADGNCTATGGHLDPFNRGENRTCDTNHRDTCQLGDLSGKHGAIIPSSDFPYSFRTAYRDLYLSTQPGTAAFLGNRSLVVHDPDHNRINCGNFIRTGNLTGSTNPTTTSSTTPSIASSTTSDTPAPASTSFVGAAVGREAIGTLAVMAAAVAFVM